MIEQWKSIKGYEGCYEVSNLGRVKSVKRYVRKHDGIRTVKERVLKQCYDEDGYKRAMREMSEAVDRLRKWL